MAWYCKSWGALPDSGGVHDQEYQLMQRMQVLHNTFSAVRKLRGLSGEQINTGLTAGERLLLGELQKMGLLRGLR